MKLLFSIIALITAFHIQGHAQEEKQELIIYSCYLHEPFQMGVATHRSPNNWLSKEGCTMKMAYPGGENQWGAVYLTFGFAEEKKGISLTEFKTIKFDLKADRDNTILFIDIKDKFTGPNDRIYQHKLPILSKEWKTYEVSIDYFTKNIPPPLVTPDLTQINVIMDFVFKGRKSNTVYFKNIRYTK